MMNSWQKKGKKMLNTAFFGTSNKSVPILEDLYKTTKLTLCITKSDRTVGRKKNVQETLVKKWAKEHEIEVFEIDKFTPEVRANLVERLQQLKIEIGIVADFSFILHEEILSTPVHGLINIHFSLLPKYRGASPLQHAILNGETTTGITFMKMSKGMDEGPILKQISYDLKGNETAGELYEQLFKLGGEQIGHIVKMYVEGNLKLQDQNSNQATYCFSKSQPKSTLIFKEDAKIDWALSPQLIERTIRAFNPWPIAWTTLEEIDKAQILENCQLNPKKDKKLTLKIFEASIGKTGQLEPKSLQVEGKAKTNLTDFLNGYFVKTTNA